MEAEAAAVTAGMVEREGEEGGKGGRRAEGINEFFFSRLAARGDAKKIGYRLGIRGGVLVSYRCGREVFDDNEDLKVSSQ